MCERPPLPLAGHVWCCRPAAHDPTPYPTFQLLLVPLSPCSDDADGPAVDDYGRVRGLQGVRASSGSSHRLLLCLPLLHLLILPTAAPDLAVRVADSELPCGHMLAPRRPAAAVVGLIGLRVSPHFDKPWTAKSVAAFWNKHWDLAAGERVLADAEHPGAAQQGCVWSGGGLRSRCKAAVPRLPSPRFGVAHLCTCTLPLPCRQHAAPARLRRGVRRQPAPAGHAAGPPLPHPPGPGQPGQLCGLGAGARGHLLVRLFLAVQLTCNAWGLTSFAASRLAHGRIFWGAGFCSAMP